MTRSVSRNRPPAARAAASREAALAPHESHFDLADFCFRGDPAGLRGPPKPYDVPRGTTRVSCTPAPCQPGASARSRWRPDSCSHSRRGRPRISVVTPSFNQGAYIERTIQSILDQRYPNLEYIIIDGGSTDGSRKIIERYEKHLAYWVSERDGGQADGLNKGFRRCTGEFVGWQNADDLYCAGAFERFAEGIGRDPLAEVVFGNIRYIDERDGVIAESRLVPVSANTYVYDGMCFHNQAALWRRSLFDRFGFLRPELDLLMDYEYFLRLALARVRFRFIHAFLGMFRVHSAAKTNSPATRSGSASFAHGQKQVFDALGVRIGSEARFMRSLSLLRRSAWYLAQGDFAYLVRGFRRRILGQRVVREW